MKEFNKKTSAGIISFIVLFTFFSPSFSRKAEAQWLVFDANLIIKEYALDTLAWTLINKTLERMTASTVNWINTGFKGRPAYVTDPESFYKDIGDKVVGQYIFANPNLNFLCGPISAKIKIALQKSYVTDRDRWQCTLTDVKGNFDDFMNDFEKGGWDNFFELTQRQQNNPIGAYMLAESDMMEQLSKKVNYAAEDLNQGGGFMSYKTCEIWAPPDSGLPEIGPDGNPTGKRTPICLKEVTNTPGGVINNKLNEALGSGSKKLEAADEINEIVSALLNQMLTKAVGSIGGLRGTSSADPANSNIILTNQLNTNENLTGYFGESVDIAPPVPIESLAPTDPDCSGVRQETLMGMALDEINADPNLTSADLDQVVQNLDCVPPGETGGN